MSELKRKISFTNIWKLLLEADSKVGLLLLKKPPKKKTLSEWINKLTWPRHAFVWHFILISTLIITNFKLISVIFCAALETIYIALYVGLIKYVWNKETMVNLLKWCERLYDIEKKIHPLVKNLAETHLMSIEKQATKVLKLFRNIIYTEIIIAVFGWLILGLILPESIFPKFSPPIPFYMPFEQQDNWTAFLLTMAAQSLLILDSGTIIIYIFSIFFTIIVHVLGYLDLINEVAKYIAREMKLRIQITFVKSKKSQSKKDVAENKNEESFDEWMKILTEMISDVNSIIYILGEFYSMTILLFEVSSFGALFICGLIFTVLRLHYFFAIGIMTVNLVLWSICYINEKILDKFHDIKATLYDIPWYELELREIKTLLIVMNCDEIQKGFTAAGFHNMTLERFRIVIKAGYTNLLILKDLVQK